MNMATNSQITERWAKHIVDRSVRMLKASGNVYTDYTDDTIYSYGSHFPMAHVYRNVDGTPRLVLMNGDTFSMSTTRHQNDVRSMVRKHAADVPSVIIPFTALRAARIEPSTIEVLDTKPEGFEFTLNRSADLPKGAKLVEGRSYSWGSEWGYSDEPELRWVLPNNQQVREIDGEFQWHSVRHWLGDAVIRAQDWGGRKAKYVSSFDRQETNRLYFFCELPRTRATTFEDAMEALKPDAVVLAEASGRNVTRQGDMFAVPMPTMSRTDLRKQGAKFSETAKSVSLIGTSHTATTVATMPDGTQFARGTMYHVPRIIGQWRDADHKRQTMGDGKTWHLIVKNTVPVSK